MLNVERFILFLEEYNCCEVKQHYHFAGKDEQYVFILEDKTEIIVKPYQGN